jgi:hypothetical protein
MPIYCCNVNFTFREKLVPITRHNGASIGPAAEAIVLKRVEGCPENGPFWELAAILRTMYATSSWYNETIILTER